MDADDRAREWLSAREPGPFEDGIALCADLHVRGRSELASRVLATLAPSLARTTGLGGFQKERLEIVLELEQVRPLRSDYDELLTALARATLAGDEDAIDEALPGLARAGRAPNTHLFSNLPHLRRAYEDALALHRQKGAIVSKARLAVVVFAFTVLSTLWELWPAIRHYLGIQR